MILWDKKPRHYRALITKGGQDFQEGENLKYKHFVTLETLRPNLNPFSDSEEVRLYWERRQSVKGRCYKVFLDSVRLILLGNNNFLYRKLLAAYNHYIEPSHKPSQNKY